MNSRPKDHKLNAIADLPSKDNHQHQKAKISAYAIGEGDETSMKFPVKSVSHGQAKVEKMSVAPATVSYANIHRLAEPISNRKRSKKEDIILLKASVVNGFKCPPWDKTPSTSEFLLQGGRDAFMYVRATSLQIRLTLAVIRMT